MWESREYLTQASRSRRCSSLCGQKRERKADAHSFQARLGHSGVRLAFQSQIRLALLSGLGSSRREGGDSHQTESERTIKGGPWKEAHKLQSKALSLYCRFVGGDQTNLGFLLSLMPWTRTLLTSKGERGLRFKPWIGENYRVDGGGGMGLGPTLQSSADGDIYPTIKGYC